MGVFGDRLRREREMRGVTLDEIAESTKIARRSLEALEQENFDLLPGGIFNKGFVRAYARYLGIDEEQAVAEYIDLQDAYKSIYESLTHAAASQDQPPAEDRFPLQIHEDKHDRRPPLNEKRSFMPLILALAALVLGVAGWEYWNKHRSHTVHADQEKPAVSAPATPVAPQQQVSAPANLPASAATDQKPAVPVDSSSSSSGSDKQAASSSAAPASATPADKSATPADKKGASTSPADKNASKSEHKNVPEAAAQPSPDIKPDSGKSFKVSMKAHEDSWYQVQKDGELPIEGVLKAADKQKDFKAKKELVLKIGNAGGVEVSHNGKPLGSLGEPGAPRTLTFKPDGVQ